MKFDKINVSSSDNVRRKMTWWQNCFAAISFPAFGRGR